MAFIKRFDEVWIPDYEGGKLSGLLSTQYPTHRTMHYIGPLSRFYHTEPIPATELQAPIVVLLSGPEPQRTLLEDKLLAQLQNHPTPVLLIQGLPKNARQPARVQGSVTLLPFLNGGKLKWVLQQAQHIICRSGYSTILDLVAIRKTALLIPTPGQTEQEYLGQYLSQQGWFFSQTQDNFDLHEALRQAPNYQLPTHWAIPQRWPLTL
jgi:predicted glycosyltransferase